VEDHSNRLVRTFTGNLTKMLSQMPGSFRPSSTEGGAVQDSSSRTAAGAGAHRAVGAAANGDGSKLGEWSASRLMQVGVFAWQCVAVQ
jgi:hypothetical protein